MATSTKKPPLISLVVLGLFSTGCEFPGGYHVFRDREICVADDTGGLECTKGGKAHSRKIGRGDIVTNPEDFADIVDAIDDIEDRLTECER